CPHPRVLRRTLSAAVQRPRTPRLAGPRVAPPWYRRTFYRRDKSGAGRMAIGTKKRPEAIPAPSVPTVSSSTGSVIARGMVLDGDCMAEGPLRIDGHVKGNVSAAQLVIGPGGRVDGDVIGPDGNGS